MKNLEFFGELIENIDTLTYNYNKTVVSTRGLLEKTSSEMSQLNPIEQMISRYIYLYGPFSMSKLSSLTNLKPSYLSKVTTRLERLGFCEKTQSKEDQRVYFIGLTKDNYSKVQEHVESLRQAFLTRFFAGLHSADVDEFRQNLLLIIDYYVLLLQKLDGDNDIYHENIDKYDLFELMDKRSKYANKLILFFGAQQKLPFYCENFNYYQNNTIFHLHKHGKMSISALSKLSGFSLKHLCGTLNGLIQRGFIQKTQSSSDRRASCVQLSKLGISMADEQVLLEKKSYEQSLSAHFDQDELTSFLNAHKTLNAIFQKLRSFF